MSTAVLQPSRHDWHRRALRHRFQDPKRTVLTIDAHAFRHQKGDCGCDEVHINFGLPCERPDPQVLVILRRTGTLVETFVQCKTTLRNLDEWPDDSTTHATAEEIRQAFQGEL